MTTKFAILTGSILNGFKIESVIDDAAKAENVVVSNLANGKLSEALSVEKPSSLSGRSRDDSDSGAHYLVIGHGLAGGFAMYGPFVENESASDFAENHGRGRDWECFEHAETAPVAKVKTRGPRP